MNESRIAQGPYAPLSTPAEIGLLARAIEWLRLLLLVWHGPDAPRGEAVRVGLIDFFIHLLAIALPWSTAVTTGLALAILLMMCLTHGLPRMIVDLRRPACSFPLAMVGIAILGTTWADGIPWSDRLHALEKVVKLLWLLPFYVHFQKSTSTTSVFVAYVTSNLLLLFLSFSVFLLPNFAVLFGKKDPGVPFKNYIDQSQAFAFIAVVLLGVAAESLRSQRRRLAFLCLAGALAFFADLAFINIARTAFLYLPAMLVLLALRYARSRISFAIFAGICVAVAGLSTTSPNLQSKVSRLLKEFGAFETNTSVVEGFPAGGAERLEFWRKSIGFIRSAPILGHGTGSTKKLFAAAAIGQSGIIAKVVDNPHNQTLAVTIQWGIVGCTALYAMWGAHFLMFLGGLKWSQGNLLTWIGLLAVVQNVLSSVFNSHIFDFYQGWLYVLTVAIVGGTIQAANARAATTPSEEPLLPAGAPPSPASPPTARAELTGSHAAALHYRAP